MTSVYSVTGQDSKGNEPFQYKKFRVVFLGQVLL